MYSIPSVLIHLHDIGIPKVNFVPEVCVAIFIEASDYYFY